MKQPFHRRLGNSVKKYHTHFTKYLYERDTIFATLWVFAFIFLVKFIPVNTHFLDPLKLALEDFDFNDITNSRKNTNTAHLDSQVVIVNIGELDREGLAALIEKTEAMHPAVIGLDVLFDGARENDKDSILRSVFQASKNLVVVNKIDWEDEENPLHKGYFASSIKQMGFANFISEEKGTIRMFSPYEKINDSTEYCFAAMLVKNYNPSAFETLRKRHAHDEIIKYTRRTAQYLVVEGDALLADNVDASALKGKIVLLGYVNTNEADIEDKVFTPLNEKFAGKSTPDMNGIVVHANIISMILEKNYIKKLPSWVNIFVAVLVGWLHMSFFIRYYLENHIWFHLVAKLAQLLSAIFFVFMGILLYSRYSIKLDMSLTLVVIVLAVDIIYFYEAFAVWLHKKIHYHTVFHQKHH